MLFYSIFYFALLTGLASCASLTRVTEFGANPTELQMFLYVPDKVADNPAIIVAVCLKPRSVP